MRNDYWVPGTPTWNFWADYFARQRGTTPEDASKSWPRPGNVTFTSDNGIHLVEDSRRGTGRACIELEWTSCGTPADMARELRRVVAWLESRPGSDVTVVID
jgi:hypothetical protein